MPPPPASQIDKKVDFTTPFDSSYLSGKSVLITGGAAGLGRGLVSAAAEAGAYVTIVDISVESGKDAEQEMQGKGYHVQFIQADVSSYPAQLNAFKAALAFSPQRSLDLVVACAGAPGASILDAAFPPDLAPGDDLPAPPTKTMDVNLTGVYYTTVLAIHYFQAGPHRKNPLTAAQESQETMTAHPKKHLLLVSSCAGFTELPLSATYMATKFGIRGMFNSLRRFGPTIGNVRVNLVAPWFIDTNITSLIMEDLRKLGVRFGDVEDFVQGVMKCCCDESVEGRAIAIMPKDEKNGGGPGSGNFDLCDDGVGGGGYYAMWEAQKRGLLFEGEPVDLAKVWQYIS